MKLTEDLEASEREKMYLMPDNRIVIPLNLLWEVVRKEHRRLTAEQMPYIRI